MAKIWKEDEYCGERGRSGIAGQVGEDGFGGSMCRTTSATLGTECGGVDQRLPPAGFGIFLSFSIRGRRHGRAADTRPPPHYSLQVFLFLVPFPSPPFPHTLLLAEIVSLPLSYLEDGSHT